MDKDKDKITAVYCRLAQKDDEIIEYQYKKISRYAAEHGYRNIAVYTDNGESGVRFDRPAFSKMCADIVEGKIGVVLANSIDRFGRDSIKVLLWLDELKRQGIVVKTLDGFWGDSFSYDMIFHAYKAYKKQNKFRHKKKLNSTSFQRKHD